MTTFVKKIIKQWKEHEKKKLEERINHDIEDEISKTFITKSSPTMKLNANCAICNADDSNTLLKRNINNQKYYYCIDCIKTFKEIEIKNKKLLEIYSLNELHDNIVVGGRWDHERVDLGPDRRFKNNNFHAATQTIHRGFNISYRCSICNKKENSAFYFRKMGDKIIFYCDECNLKYKNDLQ